MDADTLRSHLERAQRHDATLQEELRSGGECTAEQAVQRLVLALRISRLAHGGGDEPLCRRSLARAARWGRALAVDGSAHWEDEEGAWKTMTSTPCHLTVPLALQSMASAHLCHDSAALKVLIRRGLMDRLVRDARERRAAVGGESFWKLLGELFAAALAGESPDASTFTDCQNAFDAYDARTSAMNPLWRSQGLQPLLACAQALAMGDCSIWNASLADALDKHRSYFANPSHAGLLPELLAIELSALSSVARERHGCPVDNAAELLLTDGPAPGATKVPPRDPPPRRMVVSRKKKGR